MRVLEFIMKAILLGGEMIISSVLVRNVEIVPVFD